MPISNRIAFSRDCTVDIPSYAAMTEPDLPLRPSSYQNWSGDMSVKLAKACKAFTSGECSLRKASELYGVPKSTLHDHASGKVKEFSVSGPERYLSVYEEEELCNFLLGCSQIGYPRTRHQVLAIVQQYMIKKQINRMVSNGWWQKFCSRHPYITLRSAAPLAMPRAKAADRTVLDKYFTILKSALSDNCLLDKPRQIYNCDESGFPLSPKAVARKGDHNPSTVTSANKNQLTVLYAV